MLMKYYNFLWRSFPQDHMISFDRFSKIVPVKETASDAIASKTSEEGNQVILDICIGIIDKDQDLEDFYHLVERIIDNPKLSKIMEVLKNGK